MDEVEGSGRIMADRAVALAWSILLLCSLIAPAVGALTIARSPTLPGAPPPWALFALSFVALAFLIASSVLLIWKRRSDSVAVLLALAYLATGASLHFADGTSAPPKFEDARRSLEMLGIVCTTIAMLRFPNGRFQPSWTRWALPPLLLWAVARCLNLLPEATHALASLGIMVFSVVAVILRYLTLPQGTQRQQVRWALFGFAIGLTLNMVAVLLFTRLATATGDELLWTWLVARGLNSLFLVTMATGLLVSMLRYRLYDVDTVMSRSAAYAVLTLLLLALFAASEKIVEMLGQQWLKGSAGAITASVAAAVVAVLASPLHNRAVRWAQRRFQKNLIHLRQAVPECAADMRETSTLSGLAQALLRQVTTDIRARYGAVVVNGRVIATESIDPPAVENWYRSKSLDETAQKMDCDKGDPLFPLRIPLRLSYSEAGEPLGWFLLGSRPDGSFYGSDEQQAIAAVAAPIARALSVAALRQQQMERDEERWEALLKRVSALEAQAPKSRGGPKAVPG
jgi:hypothetical protein